MIVHKYRDVTIISLRRIASCLFLGLENKKGI